MPIPTRAVGRLWKSSSQQVHAGIWRRSCGKKEREGNLGKGRPVGREEKERRKGLVVKKSR